MAYLTRRTPEQTGAAGGEFAAMMIVPDMGSDTAARRATPASASLLEAAIERGGLHPFFHAKVAMSSRKIVGAEALARIATPQMGFASPAAYVELAERNQRIDALTFAMARAVAKHAGGSAGLADINRSRRADAIR